jgi:molybdopterin-guanine dinucleotide biosynthesis protein A
MTIAGLILAGGQGSRFGGVDKAFLPLRGRTLLEHLIARLAPQLPVLAISANGDPARFAGYGLPVLPDTSSNQGPLAGLAAGLAWAASQDISFLVTVPVDTPCIPMDLVARLTPGPSVATYQGRQHHLVALWPASLRPALDALLATPGPHRARDALALCAARPVAFEAAADPFLNINTPEDLAAADIKQESGRF